MLCREAVKMSLKEINRIQICLIKESKYCPDSWIAAYSEKFRRCIELGIVDINEIRIILG